MKVSIIMPVYNDESTVSSAVESVLSQSHKDWELLIMDDGSTDRTGEVIRSFCDERIKIFRQENRGQLVALNNLSPHISGDFVLLLHADDRLYRNDSVERNLYLFEDDFVDGIYSDTVQFFNSGKADEIIRVPRIAGINSVKMLFARLGSNLIIDHFFVRRAAFENTVRPNYLRWYLPYWIKFGEKKVTSMKLKYTSFPWYHYRVYDMNYTNSVIGNFEVYFTRFRTIFFLSDYFSTPFPLIQKELSRRFNFNRLVFNRKSSKAQIARCFKANLRSMKQRTQDANTWYFEQLLLFYQSPTKKVISLINSIELAYTPAESRKFYNDLINNALPPVCNELTRLLKEGFETIVVKSDNDALKLRELLKFLCIRAKVIIG